MSERSIPDARFQAMRRELGRIRRREQRKRQATHLLSTMGYAIVVLAVVIVLLSL